MRERSKSTWLPPDTATNKDATLFDETKRDRVEWLNPIAMSQLQRAVKARKKTVVLNGDMFDITYGIRFESSVTDSYEQIKLKRTDGSYVPFGYVRLDKILAFDFEDKEK